MSEEPQELIEAVAETARELLAADSLSISRLEHPAADAAHGPLLRTLINVGSVAAGELRWPTNETYPVEEFPDTLGFLVGQPVRHRATHVDDPTGEPAEVALLLALGKRSSLKTPILLGSTMWGELWAARRSDAEPFTEQDGELAEVIVALVAAGLSQADTWQRMQVLAGTDPLTGLANRRAFDEHLRRFLARTAAAGQPCAVAVGDVNGLKRVNDTLGHAAGDDALRRAAHGAAASTSAVADALAGRLGGDEFALVLPGLDCDTAMAVAQHWCDLARHDTYGTSLACGIAITDPIRPASSAEAVLRSADEAQYRAKQTRSPRPLLAPSVSPA